MSKTKDNGTYILISAGQSGSVVNTLLSHKLQKEGIDTENYIFNSSEFDVKGMEAETYYILGDGKGTGKNPDLGKKIARENKEELELLLEEIFEKGNNGRKKYREPLAVYFTYGASGGTGSGFSPVIISKLKKVFGRKVPIFVNAIKSLEYETTGNINFLNNVIDISTYLQSKSIVYNIIDNQKFADNHNTTDFTKINNAIVNFLLLLNYDYVRKYSQLTDSFTLDRRDFYRYVSQKGGSGGLLGIYGYKNGKIENLYQYGGLDKDFSGARKALCVVKDSSYIKDVKKTIDEKGGVEVLEFKSLNFSDKVINQTGLQSLVYAIGEYKTDGIVDHLVERYVEGEQLKEKMKEKDSVKQNIKASGTKKVRVKF